MSGAWQNLSSHPARSTPYLTNKLDLKGNTSASIATSIYAHLLRVMFYRLIVLRQSKSKIQVTHNSWNNGMSIA